MERQLQKLDECLKETLGLAKTHKEISEIDIIEYNEFHKRICTEHEDGEKHFASFQKLVKDYNDDKSKFSNELKQIKSLLSNALKDIDSLLVEKQELLQIESKFGSRLGEPNDDFIKLISQNILKTDTKVYIETDGKKVYGSFTSDGYFKLDLNDKRFSSLTTAASYVCDKTKVNGWQLWYCVEETGVVQELKFYQTQIS